jgi:hypothetical protein
MLIIIICDNDDDDDNDDDRNDDDDDDNVRQACTDRKAAGQVGSDSVSSGFLFSDGF